MLEKLGLKGIDVSEKEKITVMKRLLIENYHPSPKTEPYDKKKFLTKFIMATDWMKYNLSDALAQIFVIRQERIIF